MAGLPELLKSSLEMVIAPPKSSKVFLKCINMFSVYIRGMFISVRSIFEEVRGNIYINGNTFNMYNIFPDFVRSFPEFHKSFPVQYGKIEKLVFY